MSNAIAIVAVAEVLLRAPVSPAALPNHVAAGDLDVDCAVATGAPCPLAARDGTGLLEIVRLTDGAFRARLVPSAQLPTGTPLVISGAVRAGNPRTGQAVVGGYRVDFTPLMHDARVQVPANGEWVTVTARPGTAKTALPALTLQGITGSAGPVLQGITGSAQPSR